MEIRGASIEDIEEIKNLFRETVISVNSKDYNNEQISIWADFSNDSDLWNKRIVDEYFFVSEENNKILGFCSMTESGNLDMLYVHKDFQGKGVASVLMNELFENSNFLGINKIVSEVSISAKTFFIKHGFKEIKENQSDLKGMSFKNYIMAKEL
ncbi:MAG: GNAT family N-acetyltransferase [Candidatus Kapabacteria bacterium]|nr:GNAT family N-acetyltransferase [Candidatus Kapabacteria bacterium]